MNWASRPGRSSALADLGRRQLVEKRQRHRSNGGWPGHVIRDMKGACPGAEFVCDMQIKFDSNGGGHLETPEDKIEA